nr:hypothetical protein [Tanacetum cinerariifolium]
EGIGQGGGDLREKGPEGENDVDALLGEFQGHILTQAAAAASHEGDFGKIKLARLPACEMRRGSRWRSAGRSARSAPHRQSLGCRQFPRASSPFGAAGPWPPAPAARR